jgi:ABC-type uncharacterized transport system substrate-binding protein
LIPFETGVSLSAGLILRTIRAVVIAGAEKRVDWRRRPWALVGLILGLMNAPRAEAHPHVWIDYDLTVNFDAGHVTSLQMEWSFDEDFTAAVLRDIVGDKKPPKTLAAADVAKIEKNAFSNLKNYDYFTHVFVGDGKAGVGAVKGFTAKLNGAKLLYSFTLALAQPVAAKPGPLGIGIWDDTYYVDVGPAEGKPPKLSGSGSASCKAVIIDDHQHPIYFGSVFPKVVRVTC